MSRQKTLNVAFLPDEYTALKDVKGERSWPTAILEEFGVSDSHANERTYTEEDGREMLGNLVDNE